MDPKFSAALLGDSCSKKDTISGAKITSKLKRDAVAKVEDRGYPVSKGCKAFVGQNEADLQRAALLSEPMRAIKYVAAKAQEGQ
ncbi:MAG: hypothetical protein K9G43_04220 [Rhodobacteraceae bacterium]|nr:hypothetical protein [Paracoccaceae bacterium]